MSKQVHLGAHFPGVNNTTVWSDPAAGSQIVVRAGHTRAVNLAGAFAGTTICLAPAGTNEPDAVTSRSPTVASRLPGLARMR